MSGAISMRIHANYPLIAKEMFDLIEELLALLDMRKVRSVVKRDPFDFGYTIEKWLHCTFLYMFL
jgi:hypothetical protein